MKEVQEFYALHFIELLRDKESEMSQRMVSVYLYIPNIIGKYVDLKGF